jgi:hypothetical protein
MRTDIEEAMKACGDTILMKGVVRHLGEYLDEGENVRALAAAAQDTEAVGGSAVLALTNRRVLFFGAAPLRKAKVHDQVPLAEIKSVDYEHNYYGSTSVRIRGERLHRFSVPRKDAARIVHDIEQAARVEPRKSPQAIAATAAPRVPPKGGVSNVLRRPWRGGPPLERGIVFVAWQPQRAYNFPDECVACGASVTETRAIRLAGWVSKGLATTGRRSAHVDVSVTGVGYCSAHAPKQKDVDRGSHVRGDTAPAFSGFPRGIKYIGFDGDMSGQYLTDQYVHFHFKRPEYARAFAIANRDAVAQLATFTHGPDVKGVAQRAQEVLNELEPPSS